MARLPGLEALAIGGSPPEFLRFNVILFFASAEYLCIGDSTKEKRGNYVWRDEQLSEPAIFAFLRVSLVFASRGIMIKNKAWTEGESAIRYAWDDRTLRESPVLPGILNHWKN